MSGTVSPSFKPSQPTWAFFLPWPLISERGGVNQVVLHLLARCDFQPLLIENDWTGPHHNDRFGFHAIGERVRGPFSGGLARYVLRATDTFGRLLRLVRENHIAVVNPHFPGTEVISFLLLRRWCGFKVILSFHGSDIRTALRSKGLERAAYRWMLRAADAVVACSYGLLEEIRMLEPRMQKAVVIHNGADPLPLDGEPVCRREPGTQVIVTVGAFQPGKGHDVLLAAYRLLREKRPQARLWIIGARESALAHTQKLAAEFGDDVRIFVDQPHASIGPTLLQADVFAFSSRYVKGKVGEGLPLVLLEAGILGLPVVSTRCCGTLDVIDDHVNGRLVPPEDPEAMAEALDELLGDPATRRSLGEALRDRVLSDFRWDDAWQQYRELAAGLL
jgi:glycosyltransferase involved in cell wall biosynthesis